jgi:hypothetical protein
MRYLSRIPSAIRRSSNASTNAMAMNAMSMNGMARMRPFSDVAISEPKPNYFDFSDLSRKPQPLIDFENMSKRDGRRSQNIHHVDVAGDGDESEGKGNGVKSAIPGNFDISSLMVRPSANTVNKFAIGTLIVAFLTILIEKTIGLSSIKSGIKKIKDDALELANDITESVCNYIIATASDRLQEGDTTIIASMYMKVGQHVSVGKRKEMLENLVINGISYGWLAPYDGIIEQWLNKIIEIKGGQLPSDKYIFNIVNIIRNKVIPFTNGIWYFKRAVKLRTGLGMTDADIVPDVYWNTSEGRVATANSTRDIIAEDTVLAKIIVGLLTANEAIDNTNMLFDRVFSNVNSMLKILMITFKTHLADAKNDKSSILDERILHSESFDSEMKTEISELKKSIRKCESFLDPSRKTRSNLFKSPRRISRTTTFQKDNDRIGKLQREFGVFDPTLGGGTKRRSTRSNRNLNRNRNRSRSRSRNAMRRTRRVQHI